MTEIVTERLGFGWGWDEGEDGWKDGVDKNFRMSDVYHGMSVISDALTAPPGSPADGDIYIPAATATGAWATHEGKVAAYQDGTWYFYNAVRGLRSEFQNHGDFRSYNGTVWVSDGVLGGIADLEIFSNIEGSTAVPSGNNLTDLLDAILGNTEGAVIARGTEWTSFAPSGAGQVLVSQTGTATPLAWEDLNIGHLAEIGSKKLVGNYDTVTGPPDTIVVGTHLTLTNDGSLNVTGVAPSASPVFTGSIDASAVTHFTVPTPTTSTDVVNKAYADALATGMRPRPTADWGATSALEANTYSNGTSGIGATLTGNSNGALAVDGGAPTLNQIVLVTAEVTSAHNGLYVQTQLGDGSHPYILTRHDDMNTTTDFVGTFLSVANNGANGNSLWRCDNIAAPVMGTDPITFTEMNKATDLHQGNLVVITGNTISVAPTINAGFVLANTGSVSGAASAVAVTGLFDQSFGTTVGGVIQRGVSAWAILSPGTAGQVLKAGGTGTVDSWANELWNGPSISSLGTGISGGSGTLSAYSQITQNPTAGSTITITGTALINDAILNLPAGGTVTVAASPTAFMPVRLHIHQNGSTACAVVLNTGFVFAVSGAPTSYTVSAGLGSVDMLGLLPPDTSHYRVGAIGQGWTV